MNVSKRSVIPMLGVILLISLLFLPLFVYWMVFKINVSLKKYVEKQGKNHAKDL